MAEENSELEDAGAGLECVRNKRPFPLGENIWLLHAPFHMFGALPIDNNAVLIKDPKRKEMIVVNLTDIDEDGFRAVEELCEFQEVRLAWLISTGDWHHFSIRLWQDHFPEAQTVIASKRPLKVNPDIRAEGIIVLDRENPEIEAISEDTLKLVPWLGSRQPGLFPNRRPRVEVIVFHKPSGTLFITDHLLVVGEKLSLGLVAGVQANQIGFRVMDRKATQDSVKRVMGIKGVRCLVFSHGKPSAGAVQRDEEAALKARLAGAYGFFT
ncbi:Hypothetical Protein FCC1311_096262 [Hondaea fermentalgiana]|uniref:MBL fold metallo-hydrolase n=1 Tax=Hondaea fermentalgiana TaxID=2315210 RepID=A0A2R5GXI0_9STRA|nr:Hypothetical Protein FCC1311_096262 [Hondaea fermentalgiana]|eukprot:GBG33403.1 Hypothetical Protein FCC1311_096262 [Hondaea fermentalgiana]